jgi:hypothetical protein
MPGVGTTLAFPIGEAPSLAGNGGWQPGEMLLPKRYQTTTYQQLAELVGLECRELPAFPAAIRRQELLLVPNLFRGVAASICAGLPDSGLNV